MIPNQVFEQLSASGLTQAQLIIVMKMLMVTAENARAVARAELRDELGEMRQSFGRLIIEAVQATEDKIFARLAEERRADEAKKRERREKAALRKREREAAAKAAQATSQAQGALNLGDDVPPPDAKQEAAPAATPVAAAPPPRMKADMAYAPPASGSLAAKFEENPEYAKLMAEWENQAKANETKPKGSPLGAMQSLGNALIEGLQKQLESQEAQDAQDDILRVLPEPAFSEEMLQAAE